MTTYLEIDVIEFNELLFFYSDMSKLLIELNKERNSIEREIGIDTDGRIVHRFPGSSKYGAYGLNDQILGLSSIFEREINKDFFELIWERD